MACVPRPVLFTLLIGLLLQTGLHASRDRLQATQAPLPVPLQSDYLNISSLGDPVALSKLLMLWLQGFDYQPGISIPFVRMDYPLLIKWLDAILLLDPDSHYALLSAVRIYSEVPDDAKKRQILDFVYRKFLENPAQRWPWMAHAVYVARHRLNDKQLALVYARELRLRTTGMNIPDWAKQMELFALEDVGEPEAARILLGGLIESGEITEQREIDFLTSRLSEDHHTAAP